MSKLPNLILMTLVGIMVLSGSAFSQDRGDDRGDRRERRRGNWDPSEYLERLDANKNGQMDPGELRGGLADYVRRMGFSTEQPILITEIINKANGNSDKSKTNSEARKREFVRKVPGFGVENKEIEPVRNFSTDGSISNPEILRRKYGESIMSEVERTLERYDGNGNGKLDANEIKRGNWGRPGPEESDLNKNGELSKNELAERYKQRKSQQNDRGSRGDRRDDNSRGGDRRRDDDNSRGRDWRRDRGDRGDSRGDSRRDTSDSSSDRAKAKAAAERASMERAREERMKEDERRRDDSRDSAARARAKAAAEAARRQRDNGSDDRRDDKRDDDGDKDREATYRAYAKKMIEKYDKNKDDVISKEEMESFRRPPENHDPDGNGEVTFDELFEAYKNRDESRKSSNSGSRRESNSRDRSSASRNRSSSGGTDVDGDGKIKMVEFADEWTQEKIEEFQRLDVNNDGFLSKEEFRKR